MNLALHAIWQTATGAIILTDWLGDGGHPVASEVAERRASICVSCPENRQPKWWDIHKNAIAAAIQRMLAIKAEAGFRVSVEQQLHMCRCCGCCNRLKVHTPLKHILSHTKDVSIYPDHCWVKQESQNVQLQQAG